MIFGWGAAVLAVALGVRYGLLESGFLPADCGGSLAEGVDGWCGVKWAVVQSFVHQRLGWASLAFGIAAFLLRRRELAWSGWLTGVAGLVLYSFDMSAVGALLSLLVLARAAEERRARQDEAGEQPGDGLGVGRLA